MRREGCGLGAYTRRNDLRKWRRKPTGFCDQFAKIMLIEIVSVMANRSIQFIPLTEWFKPAALYSHNLGEHQFNLVICPLL
jgi:hypothetical protein